jgi:hypothetical protein
MAPGASGFGGRAAPSRYGNESGAALRSEGGGGSPERFFSRGNEKLYEAYSQLHTMAQDFDKPFDSPAILVVGHQTDGKSGACALNAHALLPPLTRPLAAARRAALVEALMGFQFNHVGGGTKTRRPIAINMKYNALCHEPRCYLARALPLPLAACARVLTRLRGGAADEGGRGGGGDVVGGPAGAH